MSDLIEHILNEDYVSANQLFESRISEIMESKLYEVKRSIDITEVVKPVRGKPGQFKGQNTPKDWSKYRKQHPALGMKEIRPGVKAAVDKHEKTASGGLTKHGIEVRRKKGFIQAYPATKAREFIDKVIHYHKTGEVTEDYASDTAARWEKFQKSKQFQSKLSGQAPEVPPQTRGKKADVSPTRAKEFKYADGKKVALRKEPRLSAADQYQKGLDKAKDMEARGREGAVNRYRFGKGLGSHGAGPAKYRASREAQNYVKGAIGFGKRVLSQLGEDTEQS
jgi:hypothetical protein